MPVDIEFSGSGAMDNLQMLADQILESRIASDAQISPNGEFVALVISSVGSPKGTRNRSSRIWIVQLSEHLLRWQVTNGPENDRMPRWSPNGEALAFLSDRSSPGNAQLYLLRQPFREARQITHQASSVEDYSWSPDGTSIAFTSDDHQPDTDDDVILFDADRCFRRLYRLELGSGTSQPVSHRDLQVWEHCWSPDSSSLAAIVSDSPLDAAWYSASLERISVETGASTKIYVPERQIARPSWSPDGKTIAVISCRWSDPGMTGGDVILIDADEGTTTNITAGEPRSHLQAFWLPDSSGLVSILLEQARAKIGIVGPEGDTSVIWSSESGAPDYQMSFSGETGRVAAILSSPSSHALLNVICTNQPDEPVTFDLASETSIPPYNIQWLKWSSTDELPIEGIYIEPVEPTPGGKPPPMVTMVHGGPTGASTAGRVFSGASSWVPLLLQCGVAVFLPNYRGSNGYGVAFAEANVGDLGGLDLDDVLTGVDHCVEHGLADATRLGIGGWSYGGYLTPLAICRTDRFRAAVSGASITNWFSFHGGTNIPGFDRQFIGASPHELDGPYAWNSPLFAADQVRTPILFLHGEKDDCCPPGQAFEMTRALRSRGLAVECAIYPREGHGFIEHEHLRDMMIRAVGWFITHLGPDSSRVSDPAERAKQD